MATQTCNASLYSDKPEAAKRQVQAAIGLHFNGKNDRAVHTVAGASFGLLKDLKRERGMNEAADVYLASIFYLISDFRRGTLPHHLLQVRSCSPRSMLTAIAGHYTNPC